MRRYVGVIVAAATGLALVTMSPGVANAAQVKCKDALGVVLLGNYSAKTLPNGQYRIVTSPVKGSTLYAPIDELSVDSQTVDVLDVTDGTGNRLRKVITYSTGARVVHSKPKYNSWGFFWGWGTSVYTGPKPKALRVNLGAPDPNSDYFSYCDAQIVFK